MKGSGQAIVEEALALWRAPDRLALIREQALPADVRPLLRIVAGDVEAIALAERSTGEPAPVLREAAALYVQQTLLSADDGDSYRILGVNPDAGDERIREHYRLLARWLHPDRNADGWEAVYVYRINAAWHDLRSAERRRRFDRRRGDMVHTSVASVRRSPPVRPSLNRIAIVSSVVPVAYRRRQLSAWILGGLGVVAMIALAGLYSVQPSPKKPRAATAQVPQSVRQGAPPLAAGATNPLPDRVIAEAGKTPIEKIDSPAVASEATALQPAVEDDAKTTEQAANVASVETIEPAPLPPTSAAAQARTAPVVRPESAAVPQARTSIPAPALASVDLAAAAPVAAAPPAPLIDESRAQALIRRFTYAYEAGDLDHLSRLLTRASDGDADGRKAILREYQRLFRASDRRRIRISAVSWIEQADGVVIIASFDASIFGRGKTTARQVSGDIRFDLRHEDGDLRIHRLRHESYGS